MAIGAGSVIIESGAMSTNTLSMTAIPQTYSHLELQVTGCYDEASVANDWLYFKFNGETGTEYGFHGTQSGVGAGLTTNNIALNSSTATGGASGSYGAEFPGTQKSPNPNGVVRWFIMNYANTTVQKPFILDYCHVWRPNSTDETARLGNLVGKYPTTSTSLLTSGISQIDVIGASSYTFKSGTRYMLVGWP